MSDRALAEEVEHLYLATLKQEGFALREGQRQMIDTVVAALEREDEQGPRFCVVEAGTGIGKTLAYLVAGLPIARARKKRLVVVTSTVALQDQLLNKDIPSVAAAADFEFSVAPAKGRQRYLCLSRAHQLVGGGFNPSLSMGDDRPPAERHLEIYSDMLGQYGADRWDGVRDTWDARLEGGVWRQVTTDHLSCSKRRCSHFAGCAYYRARELVENADLLVANQALVMADLRLGGGAVLPPPEDCIYIFDEAHHLEDRALQHFRESLDLAAAEQFLDALPDTLDRQSRPLPEKLGLKRHFAQVVGTAEAFRPRLQDLRRLLEDLVTGSLEMEQARSGSRRLQHCFPAGRLPEALVQLSQEAATLAAEFVRALERLHNGVTDEWPAISECLGESQHADALHPDAFHAQLGGQLARAHGMLALLETWGEDSGAAPGPKARWIDLEDAGGKRNYGLFASPVQAGDILLDNLWERCGGAVLTSATLKSLNSFEHLRGALGIPEDASYQSIPSPFFYDQAATLRIPPGACNPRSEEAHTAAIVAGLGDCVEPGKGTLVLFSSYRQMQQVYKGLEPRLRALVLMQEGELSKQAIVQRHRQRIDAGKSSVIFGVASFAEGIDLPGDYCTQLVIARIPFAVPGEPILATRGQLLEERGGNSFMEISLPDAAMSLTQALGRLLRSETDSGVATLFDRRLISTGYGRDILESLPPFARQFDPPAKPSA